MVLYLIASLNLYFLLRLKPEMKSVQSGFFHLDQKTKEWIIQENEEMNDFL